MSKYNDLVKKLREIFQIDKPDLDFGIYRIINQRADQIDHYLNHTLREKVETEIGKRQNADADSKRNDLIAQIRDEFGKRAFDDAGNLTDGEAVASELGQQLLALDAGAATNEEHENAVFSHLLTFFSRYYDKGDFISQRRYKGDTYAIPYSGEEVMLHWANKDQYYIKSGENFSNYTFKLGDGRKVHFRLVAADTAKDNRKDNDKDRRFALVEAKTIVRTDEEGEQYEETITPIEECEVIEGGVTTTELVLRFEYIPVDKKTKQDALNAAAIKRIFEDATIKARWLDLSSRKPTEKNPQRTLLEKNLTDYTSKNSADYFIHKDLEGFLRNELDFYIKNEVMHLDDVQEAERFADIEKNLRMIQCFRAIGRELIRFLAQIENFQKKLWLKKKFVVETNYCITLDRVPEELYPEIAANDVQREEWVKLFAIDEIRAEELGQVAYSEPLTVEFLKANDKLLIDTKFYGFNSKFKILASIQNLDESTDGLLIGSENFQALTFLQRRYRGQVKSVYIDPPYNTDASAIIYKNGYKNSSWLSLIEARNSLSSRMMSDDGILCLTIDDFEFHRVRAYLENFYGKSNFLGVATIKNNPSGRSTAKGFSISHEYGIFFSKTEDTAIGRLKHSKEQAARYKHKDDIGYFEWVNFRKHGGANANRSARRKLYYPIFVSEEDGVRFPMMTWDDGNKDWILNESPKEHEKIVYPVDGKGDEKTWKWGIDTAREKPNEFTVRRDQAGELGVYKTSRINTEGTLPITSWDKNTYSATEYGTNLLKKIFGESERFSFPKSLEAVVDSLRVSKLEDGDTAMDYFAGSGTAGHAVIKLNREDAGSRKYILTEMGAHFNDVLIPRIKKVVYAPDWKNGQPVSRSQGISHCFKYIRLESYEDTLNNLELQRDANKELFTEELEDDYLLNYMLDVESQGSLLSVDDFKKPFDYTLKIAADSAGAFTRQKVDMVETFNYLIGLRVKHIDAQLERGYITVEGTLPSEERCLVLWRDCELVDYDALNTLCEKLQINPKDSEYDVVYINGDHNIPSVTQETEDEGGISRSLKLRQIEPEFLKQMFEVEDV